MPRRIVIVLLAVGVVCAGVGVGVAASAPPPGGAAFGWTAYSPLSKTVYSAGDAPVDLAWLVWAPRVGVALVALGAGTAGAALTALLVRRSPTDT